MFRILSSSADTHITNKIIKSTKTTASRSTNANVGQAGSIDIYKLYNETTVRSGSSGIELTRGLIKFDYTPIAELTASLVDIRSSSFKAFLSLTNSYAGDVTPSNFTLDLYPLGKAFSEGRGMDVVAYRDLDASNWFTASIS